MKFFSRRLLAVLLLGFSSGIPLALSGATLQAWMRSAKIDLGTIGLASLVGLPYALKFVWAPFMDRFVPPLLGRRRGWILLFQLALIAAIAGLGFTDPASGLRVTVAVAIVVAFFSASQDIVIDAWRTDILAPAERGLGASLNNTGYRVAMLVSGALSLILADHLPWRVVYLIMAAALIPGVLAGIFLAQEPENRVAPPKTLREAVVLPFLQYFRRHAALEILLFVVVYKIDTVIAMALMTPFLQDLGFSLTNIGTVNKGVGFAATIVGTTLGGVLMVKMGMRRSLWVFGIIQGVSGASFAVLAMLGHSFPMMVGAIALENLASGMGTTAYQAFLMGICDRRFTATQYALLTSLMALTRNLGQAPTGFLAQSLGWPMYFMVSVVAALPGLLLLLRYPKWFPNPEDAPG